MSSTGSGRRRPYAARKPLQERREQLLDAALAVLLRDGYSGISIEAIAREAGVTRPVIYGAYDGLRPLLTALLDRQQLRAIEQLTEAMAPLVDLADPAPRISEETLTGALTRTTRRLADMVVADPATWRPILHRAEAPAPVRERIEAYRASVVGHVASLIELLGTLRGAPLDSDLAAHAVVALMEFFGAQLLEDPEAFTPQRLARGVAQLIGLAGLG